jgi:asparagine synthase (glutamine-hydrolysing)
VLGALPPSVVSALLDRFQKTILNDDRSPNMGDKLSKAADWLSATSDTELYFKMISHWRASIMPGFDAQPASSRFLRCGDEISQFDRFARMMLMDFEIYLPDDILTKIDRASMAVSLESRVPLLDHNIIEWAWTLPTNLKYSNGLSKLPLRGVFSKYLPEEFMDRPKKGFSVPISDWLRGGLRDWAEELLQEQRLASHGLFDVDEIRKKWSEHADNRRNWHNHLWGVLMFQAWYERWH